MFSIANPTPKVPVLLESERDFFGGKFMSPEVILILVRVAEKQEFLKGS